MPISEDNDGERLQKVLARAGIASRRTCEEMIAAGRVKVNGKIVTALGTKIDPATDKVQVDEIPVSVRADATPKKLYLLLNKPAGYLSTVTDPQGRPTIIDLVAGEQRLFPIGRLDADTEGLLILTNDGTFANALMHPRHGVEKEYVALLDGFPRISELATLSRGVNIPVQDPDTDERTMYRTLPAQVELIRREGSNSLIRFVLKEGKKRQVRLMAETIGHPVLQLTRVRYGSLRLGDVPVGKTRKLNGDEVKMLLQDAGEEVVKPRPVNRTAERLNRSPRVQPVREATPRIPLRRGGRSQLREEGLEKSRAASEARERRGNRPPGRSTRSAGSWREDRPTGERRDTRPPTSGGERRDTRPPAPSGEWHGSRPPAPGGDHRDTRFPAAGNERRDSRPPNREGNWGGNRPPAPNGDRRDSRPPTREGNWGGNRPNAPEGDRREGRPPAPGRSSRPPTGDWRGGRPPAPGNDRRDTRPPAPGGDRRDSRPPNREGNWGGNRPPAPGNDRRDSRPPAPGNDRRGGRPPAPGNRPPAGDWRGGRPPGRGGTGPNRRPPER